MNECLKQSMHPALEQGGRVIWDMGFNAEQKEAVLSQLLQCGRPMPDLVFPDENSYPTDHPEKLLFLKYERINDPQSVEYAFVHNR